MANLIDEFPYFTESMTANELQTVYIISTNEKATLNGSILTVNNIEYPLDGIRGIVRIIENDKTVLIASLSIKTDYITPVFLNYTVDKQVPMKLIYVTYILNKVYIDVTTEIGQIITVGTQSITSSQDATRFIVDIETEYIISVNDKDGYIKPINKTITTGLASSITSVSMPYILDIADVNLTLTAKPSIDVSQQIVTVKQGDTEVLSEAYGDVSPKTITVKSNTSYKISVNTLTDYNITPPPKTITTGDLNSNTSIAMAYGKIQPLPTYTGSVTMTVTEKGGTATFHSSGTLIFPLNAIVGGIIISGNGGGGAGGTGSYATRGGGGAGGGRSIPFSFTNISFDAFQKIIVIIGGIGKGGISGQSNGSGSDGTDGGVSSVGNLTSVAGAGGDGGKYPKRDGSSGGVAIGGQIGGGNANSYNSGIGAVGAGNGGIGGLVNRTGSGGSDATANGSITITWEFTE